MSKRLSLKLKYFSLLWIYCLSMPLYANDTSATIAAGAITYTTTNDISMDSEYLKISPDNITVTYKFTNHSDKDITSEVAFPLPPTPINATNVFPGWDESYYAYSYIRQYENNHKNMRPLYNTLKNNAFINFQRSVDNINYDFDTEVKAMDNNKNDITNILKKNNIPLSSLYLSGYMDEPSILIKDLALKKKLTQLKLLNRNGLPAWQTQIVYHWKQTFPAKKTITVSHSYRPCTGHLWLPLPVAKSFNDYIITNKNKNIILSMLDKNDPYAVIRLEEVNYILSTGANWKGPIKSFTLEIVPMAKNPLILTNLNQSLKKTSNGNYIINISNFKPNKELKILWLYSIK